MASRIIALGGEPATGKSTMMKKIIKEFLPLKTFKFGLVKGLCNAEKNLYFIGVYDGSIFCGTDKLSMAVQPDFKKLIKSKEGAIFVFEGDRLFNQSLFDSCACDLYVIVACEQTLKKRHEIRKDQQTERFLRAKKTKIKNIIENNRVKIMDNNTPEDSLRCQEALIKAIKQP